MVPSLDSSERIVVLGLGYVGLPIAVALARHYSDVVGFDISPSRVQTLSAGHDWTDEIEDAELAASSLRFSDDPDTLKDATFIIVTVPTPIDSMRRPDLSPLESACRMIGNRLRPGALVAFESTVYPGVTEDFCPPILEAESGLKAGQDFFLGYSPERINPGDKVRRLETITKIVSADCPESLDRVRKLYGSIVEAGLHEAASIRVAEAAKVIENAQRDINIAFMNEITQIFARDGISVWDVLDAARTKWNFLPFRPGLVGGHCIGVDPYYLTHKADMLGYHPQVILAGRRINDGMGAYVAQETVKKMIANGVQVKGAKVNVLGLTFKENCPDLRNSKVVDVIRELQSFGCDVRVHDPLGEAREAEHEYGISLTAWDDLPQCDAIVAAVSHSAYLEKPFAELTAKLNKGGAFTDVKSAYDPAAVEAAGFALWRL